MRCEKCGHENPDDARFCQSCGTMFQQVATGPTLTREGRAWWYPIGVWAVLTVFFLFLDLVSTRSITWSVWPVGIIGIFMVGFTLLRYADQRYRGGR